MIREVARCPYCHGGVIAVDDDPLTLLLNPDRACAEPCPHLAFATVLLHAYGPGSGMRAVEGHTAAWLWVRGEGPRRLPWDRFDPLADYLGGIAGEDYTDDRPAVEYRLAGGTAGEREEARPGTGEFALPARGAGPQLHGILDGWAFYSPDPAALVEAVHTLVGRP
jgi:hypothetical protein